MKYHTWRVAPRGWGCTREDVEREQCGQPALVACEGGHEGCDGNEGRCKGHISRDDFPPEKKIRLCRYCRSPKHFGDRCPTRRKPAPATPTKGTR